MTYIDSALLNLTERWCRRFQLQTGRTNVWLAVQLTNLSIIVYFIWAGAYFWNSRGVVRTALGLFCSALLYVLTQTVFKVPIEAYENDAYRRVAKGLRNPRRIRDAQLRISFMSLSLVLLAPVLFVSLTLRGSMAALTYSLIVLTTVVLYVLACDPLPPCAGKLREWLRGSAPRRLAAQPHGGRSESSSALTQEGSSCPSRKTNVVSIPPSVRKTSPSSWGSRSLCLGMCANGRWPRRLSGEADAMR